MQHERQAGRTERLLLGVLVSVCLVLQPLLVPLHLALEEHAHGHAAELVGTVADDHHDHGNSRHSHPHAHPHAHDPSAGLEADEFAPGGGSHPPHPAEDHLSQQHDLLRAPPSSDFGTPAALPADDFGAFDVLVAAPLPVRPRPVPQRPPPRAPARSRAPPAIV